jgi:intracellular multiplication protein IcmB
MSLLRPLVSAIDGVLDSIGTKSRLSVVDHCDLETVDDDFTLVSSDGSLISVVEVSGLQRLISGETFYHQVITRLRSGLQSLFDVKAHQIQAVFEVDPDRVLEEIRAVQEPSRETARRLSMSLDDLFEERERVMAEWTAAERCYVALWTKPQALTKRERKEEKSKTKKASAGKVYTVNVQDPLRAIDGLRHRHSSFVDVFRSQCSEVGIITQQLDSRAALRAIRLGIDPSFTGPDWSPALPGDWMYPSIRREKTDRSEWETLWPPLSWQIFPRDATVVDVNYVEIGDRIYAPIFVNLFPREPNFFSTLFERTQAKKLPWRAAFLMEGAGLEGVGFKAAVAQILGFAGAGNKMIDRSIKELRARQNQSGETVVQARMALCTWAPKGQKDLLSKRVSELARIIEGWGSCDVSEVTGDPISGLVSASLGISQGSIATKTAAPMEEFMAMMPWSRPSSPWKTGAVTWRSPDGKLMPYQPYSSLQTTWINLIFAKPGSGKSVLMNMCNLALALAPGNQRLPRIAIIDIGPSSSGLISLIRESLPPNQQHLAVHRRLRMVERDAINPFDTQLGCRFPAPTELSFLRNFLNLLVTDVNQVAPDKNFPNLASAVIEEMYRRRSDMFDANRYNEGSSPLVDAVIKEDQIEVDQKTTWWEVVDQLFVAGRIREATIAQRFAVPLLAEAVGASQDEKVREIYGAIVVPDTNEPLINSFGRMIGEALRIYPILARPTAFDVSDSRVVALDLDEVAKTGGAQADRQTEVMYMLARQVLAKDFYLNKNILPDIPAPQHVRLRDTVPAEQYRRFHALRIQELREDSKRICYDEFHRTSKAAAVRDQVIVDMREGRKWQVDVMLASQALADFDPLMVEFATGLFVMDGGNALSVKNIADTFGFQDPAELHALENRVHGPRRGGGTFLAKFSTVDGWYSMLMTATLGPIELWAFSTTTEDVAIRDKLYDRMDSRRARKILALRFPRGSAKSEVEVRREQMKDSGSTSEESQRSVIDQIVEELVEFGRLDGGLTEH